MKRQGWIAVRGVPVLLILLGLILIGCTQGFFGSGQGATSRVPAAPPWFAADSSCQFTETSVQSAAIRIRSTARARAQGCCPRSSDLRARNPSLRGHDRQDQSGQHVPTNSALKACIIRARREQRCVAPSGTSPSVPKALAIR